MCENMADQNAPKGGSGEGAEIVGNNENNINMEANTLIGEMAEEEIQKKRIRHRRRKVYENIRNQMEFYFSDANLAKDRFLSKLIEDNPEVELATFLQFNMIRELTDSIKDIKSALKHSELLSVSEDGTRVFRTKPIQIKENEDECTIYVEKLPLEANHDWLMQVFSQYGTVDYVSIPKYRSTGKIKGFAFVEFHTPEEAKRTLEVFGAVGCCLASNIEPEKLCSVITFESEEGGHNQAQHSGEEFHHNVASSGLKRTVENGGEQEMLNEEGDLEVVTLEEQGGESEKSKKTKKKEKHEYKSTEKDGTKKDEKKLKRKRKHTENSIITEEEEDPTCKDEKKRKKKQKHLEDTIKSDEEEDLSGKDEKKGKKKRRQVEITVQSEDEDTVSGEGKKKKKQIEVVDLEKSLCEVEKSNKRKRQVEVVTAEEGVDIPEKRAKVESDTEKEQDTEMENNALEENVNKRKKTRSRKKKKRKQIAQEVSALGLQVLSKTEWKRLRNKYLNLQRQTMKNLKQQLFRTRKWDARGSHTNGHSQHSEQTDVVPSGEVAKAGRTGPRFSYTPGVIVHIRLDTPITDVKKFKTEAKTHGDIQYVDVQEGATEAFLRCSTAEAAKQLMSSKPWQDVAVLEGEEDKQYWARIREDWHHVTHRPKEKKRGKDKLLARAEKALSKHIKFDETV